MGEFIHEDQLRTPRQDRVEIHLGERDTAIFHLDAWNDGQSFRQRVGFLASVGFDIADDDVASGRQFAAGGFEHGVGFADARRHAEEDLELAALFFGLLPLQGGEQRVRIGARRFGHGGMVLVGNRFATRKLRRGD